MASYITITDAETDPEAPLTSELAKKWRDNPIAIAEKATSVPIGLRLGKFLLGTMTPSSGTTTGLTGLDLTTYVTLEVVIRNVSTNNNSSVLRFGTAGLTPATGSITSASNSWYGTLYIDLASGFVTGLTDTQNNAAQLIVTQRPGGGTGGQVTNASTTINFNLSTGSFDAPASGSPEIAVYGVR
jgi:hypothetical protein